jgi:hypothetical protein
MTTALVNQIKRLEKQAENVAFARQLIDDAQPINLANRRALFAWHVGARRELLRLSAASGDLATAAGVIKDAGKLLGLYPAERAEITGRDGGPLHPVAEISDQERTNAIAAIFATAGIPVPTPAVCWDGDGVMDHPEEPAVAEC